MGLGANDGIDVSIPPPILPLSPSPGPRLGRVSSNHGGPVQGVFITIEGVEGSGKSTQLLRLSEHLRRLKLPLVVSKEPGGTALGRELRRLLLEPH
jgi:predicted ATP-dependent serine protease